MHHRSVVLGVLAVLLATFARAEDLPCRLEPIGAGQARAVVDGRTVTLADGRTLRLFGVETSEHARSALEQAVLGRELTLFRLGPERDRYGRIVAVVTVPSQSGIENSVQAALLRQGHARVSATIDDRGCAKALLAAEQEARAAALGVWAEPPYVVKKAADFKDILAALGHFAVVEGKVVSVRENGATIYVNFGRRWSEDFTVTVLKRNEHMFASSGLELKRLAGRNVRVRGVVEARGGPWIEAAHVGQIEIADQK